MLEYSKNEQAERIVGKRPVGTAINLPWEMGLYCPICGQLRRGNIDESLDWSEYNEFVYCRNCNIDIPSLFCAGSLYFKGNTQKEKLLHLHKLIKTYLEILEINIYRAKEKLQLTQKGK